MASANKDEILRRFIALTQSSREEAREYLEAAQWNEQAALDFFFDSISSQSPPPPPPPPSSKETRPSQVKPNRTDPYESDDDLLQTAIEESLRIKAPEKPVDAVPKRFDQKKSIVSSSKINTVDNLRKNRDDSDDDDEGN